MADRKEVGRQHQGVDRREVHKVSEGSGEQKRMTVTGCENVFGAPVPPAVEG